MDMTAEEYLEQNTEYTGNEFDVFHIIDIAKFMNDFAKFKTKELEDRVSQLEKAIRLSIEEYYDIKTPHLDYLIKLINTK